MAQPSSGADSDSARSCGTVFVSTNLDTHLAFSVSVSDTVGDLKKKILLEHPICFPKVGEIEIHSLKIKRKGIFYHLVDSVYVKNALAGVKSNGYLYLDASTLDQNGVSGWLANSNGLPMPQIEYNPCANQELPITERFCSGESSRESSKNQMAEVKLIGDNHLNPASPFAATMRVLERQGTFEDLEVPDKQNKPTARENKRNQHKKKKEDAVCDLVVKENDALAGVPPKPQHGVVVADNTRRESGSVVQEPCRSKISDSGKQLDSGVQKPNDLSKGIGDSLQDTDNNIDESEIGTVIGKRSNLLGLIQDQSSPAKKKRKTLGSAVQKTNDRSASEGIEVSVPQDNKNEKPKNGDIFFSVQSSPAKKKRNNKKNNRNEDVYKEMTILEYPLGENTGKKKRKSSDRPKAVDTDVSHVEELRGESGQGTLDDNHKDFGEIEAIVAGESVVQGEKITKVDSTSLKAKYEDLVEQVVEGNVPNSSDVDMGDPNTCDAGDVSGVKNMDTSRSSTVDLKDTPSSIAQEIKDLESNREVGGQENTIPEYIKRTRVDQSDGIEEAIELCQNDSTEDITPEPAKSSKKANKSKKAKKAGRGDAKKKTQEKVTPLQEISKSLVGGENVDGKKKRTSKKREIDVAGSVLEIQEKDHNTDLNKILVVSSDMERNIVSNSISLMDNDGETEKRNEEKAPSLQEISKSQAGSENVDKKRKITIKKQVDVDRVTLEVQDADLKIPVVSSDRGRNDVLMIKTDGISVIDTEEEVEKRTEEVVPSLQEISKSQAGGENVDMKKKRTTKKMQTEVAINDLDVQEKDQDAGIKIPMVSSDRGKNDVSEIKTHDISVVATEEETEMRTEEEVPSLQEISQSQADAVNVAGKKKRITKKRQTEVARSTLEVQEKYQDDGLNIPAVSSDTVMNDVSRIKTDDISLMATTDETEKRTEEEVPLLQEISKSRAGGENVDGKKKKTRKKKQTGVARIALEVQEKDQDANLNIPLLSSDMGRNDVSKIKADVISKIAAKEETEKKTEEEVPLLQEISKSQAGGETVNGKKKRTTKKRQADVARSTLEVQEDQDDGLKIPVVSSDTKVVGVSSKRAKKTKLVKSSSLDPKSVHVKESSVAVDTLDTELVSGPVDCSQIASHTVQGNDEDRALEAVGNANSYNSGNVKEGNSQKEVSCESNGVNIKGSSGDGQDEREVKSAGKVVDSKVIIRENKSDRETKTKKKAGKLDVPSTSESPNLQTSLKVIQSQGSKRKSPDGNSSPIKLPKSSLNKSSEPLPQSNKKAPKVSASKMTPAHSSNSSKLNSVSEEPKKPDTLITSGFSTPMGKHNKGSLKRSKGTQSTKMSNNRQSHKDIHPRSVRKSSGGNLGEVVNKTDGKKSLLATSSAIFRDDSSRSSSFGDQGGVDSDASTRTPSNNLSSSDFSDGESNASQNGSDISGRMEDGKKTPSQTFSSVPKSMKLDAILRSSSSYKKLQLSQSQAEDAESQPIDFVPDSEANP